MDGIRNIAQVYRRTADRFADRVAFGTRTGRGEYSTITYKELYERGLALATALMDLGVGKGDHVGLLADNRLEWILADYAIQIAGAADVPRAADVTPSDIEYILGHAEVRVVFVENERVLGALAQCRANLPLIEHVIVMEGDGGDGVASMADLERAGAGLRASGDRRAEERIDVAGPADLFTIIYTSGTTGQPKGVQLTHANMLSQIRLLPIELRTDDRMLSILPVWHSYERVFLTAGIANGVGIWYTSPRTLAEDLVAVAPTIMASAPRLWESLHAKIVSAMAKERPLKRTLFGAAVACAVRVLRARQFFRGRELDTEGRTAARTIALALRRGLELLAFGPPHLVLDAVVLKKVRVKLGGRFRGTVSGGGALPLHIDEFFNAIGVPVLEGYGLTETSPVAALRLFDNLVIGTVGPPFPETDIRIVDPESGAVLYPDPAVPGEGRGRRGEIHIRGPQVMKGYYRNPEATDRVLKDGWLNSGDLGMITYNGCIRITGRSKDTIVLSNGENIEPVPIETRLLESPLIEQCLVVGQDRKHLTALIVPSLSGTSAESLEAAAADPKVSAAILREVRRLVSAETGFKPFERIVDVRCVPRTFEVGDELTGTYKLRRNVIAEKYAALVDAMYRTGG